AAVLIVLLQHVENPDDETLLRFGQRLEALRVAHRPRRKPPLSHRLWCEAEELVDVEAEQPREPFENEDGHPPVPNFVSKHCLLRNTERASQLRLRHPS